MRTDSALPRNPSMASATGPVGSSSLEIAEEHVAAEALAQWPRLDPGQVDARGRRTRRSASTSAPGWSSPSSEKTSEVFQARSPSGSVPAGAIQTKRVTLPASSSIPSPMIVPP